MRSHRVARDNSLVAETIGYCDNKAAAQPRQRRFAMPGIGGDNEFRVRDVCRGAHRLRKFVAIEKKPFEKTTKRTALNPPCNLDRRAFTRLERDCENPPSCGRAVFLGIRDGA